MPGSSHQSLLYSLFKRCGILSAVITAMAFIIQPLPTNATSAYKQGRLPLKCFVKFMAAWPADDFNKGVAMADKMIVSSATTEDIRIARIAGNEIWKSYEKDLQPLIDNWEEILREPLPAISNEMAATAEPVLKDKDHTFLRKIGRLLALFAAGKAEAGHHEQAVILSLVNLRFSQIAAVGDHDLPSLISLMIGIAIGNLAIDSQLWNLLDSGKLSRDFLRKCVEHLARMSREEPDLKLLYEIEATVMLKVCIYNAYGPKQIEKYLKEHAGKITEQQINTLSQQTEAEIRRLQKEFIRIYEEFSSQPRKLKEKHAEFEEMIHKSSEPTIPPTSTIPELTGRTMYLAIAPKFRSLHDKFIQKKYRIIGTGILAATIYGEGESRSSAQEFVERAGKRLPRDFFLEEEGKCRIHHKNGRIVAYSVGMDGKDDGGDPKKDIILFEITRP